MSDGVKLASGYVELTVKSAGDAMKEITAEITGVEKTAKTSGQKAGKALNDGFVKGATEAGKTIHDAITAGAEKAGQDAGEAISEGVTKGAKDAGKSINDEIGKATKTGRAAVIKDLGGTIVEGVRRGAKDAGIDLNQVLVDAAGKAGAKAGEALHDAIAGTHLGELIQPAVDGVRSLGDAIAGIKSGDAAGTLNGVAGGLKAIGQSGAADAMQDLSGKVAPLQTTFTNLKTQVDGTGQLLRALGSDSPGIAGKLGQIGTAASAMAGPLAAAAAAALEIDKALHIDSNTFDPGQHGWGHVLFGKVPDWLGLTDPSTGLDKHNLPDPSAPPVIPPMTDDQKNKAGSVILPGYARGTAGVSPVGQVYGPGSGTSDSILGVDANGVPVARVSTGEGVVRKSAMDKGGAQVVAALNAGLKLPGYDDGTNNVGGPPIPMPEAPPIQVPEATTGAAGQLNDFLNSSQGHPYEYGTLYDCGGFMSQIYNKMTGKQMPRFNTESDLAAYGFVRGSKPGEFNLGIHHGGGGPNSHMAGTLPDGRAVESGGNGVQIGAGAHGASDPQFEDHWFLPGSGGMAGLGASITGTPADAPATGDAGGKEQRTEGYIPAGAGGSGQAGTSFASGALQMGAQAVNGLIEQAGSAAATAVSAAATAGSFGAGGQAAGPASSFLIGIGTKMAERGVKYGFQMAGIGIDSLAEIMSPFGVPRFFQTSPTQFMPQLPGKPAATTTGEKAEQAQDNPQAAQAAGIDPSGPVQPGQMPGQQPVAAPAPIATPGTGDFKPAPTPVGPALSGPTAPAVSTPQAPAAAVQGPPPGTPPAAPTPKQSSSVDQLLSGLYGGIVPGLARGGVVPSLFDDGGWLMPNGVAINKTSRPEPILNDEQWGNLHTIASQSMPEPDPKAYSGGGDYSMTFNEGSIVVKDVEAMQRELDSRQRLQRMRYGGRP